MQGSGLGFERPVGIQGHFCCHGSQKVSRSADLIRKPLDHELSNTSLNLECHNCSAPYSLTVEAQKLETP